VPGKDVLEIRGVHALVIEEPTRECKAGATRIQQGSDEVRHE
jgi:hypothetical protein